MNEAKVSIPKKQPIGDTSVVDFPIGNNHDRLIAVVCAIPLGIILRDADATTVKALYRRATDGVEEVLSRELICDKRNLDPHVVKTMTLEVLRRAKMFRELAEKSMSHQDYIKANDCWRNSNYDEGELAEFAGRAIAQNLLREKWRPGP